MFSSVSFVGFIFSGERLVSLNRIVFVSPGNNNLVVCRGFCSVLFRINCVVVIVYDIIVDSVFDVFA